MHYNTTLYTLDTYALKKSCPNLSLSLNESTSTEASEQDILLFTGSIIDKSEIYYRELMKKEALYFTIIPDDFDEENVDPFWHMHTIVLKESFANEVLSSERIESFLNILETVENFTSLDIEKHLKENELQDDDFENYTPVNITDYQPQDDFLGGLASGFRGASKEEVVYKLNYNGYDKKGTKAVIARFSTKEDEQTCTLLSVGNIENEEELAEFYIENQDCIHNFMTSQEEESIVSFNGKDIVIKDISNNFDDEFYLVLVYKNDDKIAIALFRDDKLLTLYELHSFKLIKNYSSSNVMPSSLKTYKNFLSSIQIFDDSEEFQTNFSKIINSTRNQFLIKQLNETPDGSYLVLQEFYNYLINKQGNQEEKGTKNQISSLLRVLFSAKDINSLNERFITNFYFYIRNSILKNNTNFLKTFDDYAKQYKLKPKILKEIEECIGTIKYDVFPDTRSWDKDYLKYLKSRMYDVKCTEHLDEINKLLIKLDKDNESIYENPETELAEEFLDPKLLDNSFESDKIAKHLTYIYKFLSAPTQLNTDLGNKLDVQFILNLLTMCSIQFLANEENTLSIAKSFIQKNYLSKTTAHKKVKWRFAVSRVLYKIYKESIKLNPYSAWIHSIDLDQFNTNLIKEFNLLKDDENSFISNAPYKLVSFISIKAAEDKFNKYFYKADNADFVVIHLEQLFGKHGSVINLLEKDKNNITHFQEFSIIKTLLCKGRISESKSADKLCLEFLDTLQIVKPVR